MERYREEKRLHMHLVEFCGYSKKSINFFCGENRLTLIEFCDKIKSRDEIIFEKAKPNYQDKIVKYFSEANIKKVEREYISSKIKFLSRYHDEEFNHINTKSDSLFYVGNIGLIKNKSVSSLGSRDISSDGLTSAIKILSEFKSYGGAIYCGLNCDIEEVIALNEELKGNVVVFLPCGHNKYPTSFYKAYNSVFENGLIISEYSPNLSTQVFMYQARNEFMLCNCDSVALFESGANGGSIKACDIAKKFGKKVFACPSSIVNVKGAGSNQFILDNEDSFLISGTQLANHVGLVDDVKIQDDSIAEKITDKTQLEIIRQIHLGNNIFDKIVDNVNMPDSELLSTLMLMEIEGIIQKQPGNTYKVL